VRAGAGERARAAVVDVPARKPAVRRLGARADFPRPEHTADSPLLARFYVERGEAAACSDTAMVCTARRITEALGTRIHGAGPLVVVVVLDPPSAQPR